MECLQSRIDSFSKTKRVKNPSKPSSNITLKWPHPESFKATPDTLAEAGFYYDPSADDPDNVTCFMCEKELGGWEEDDDPFDIHYDKCAQKCGWANTRCGLRRDMDRHGRFVFSDKSRLPASKGMEKARLETFTAGDGWIHDGARGHGASSKKMARAGFVATPNHPGDDLATCLYCHVSLSGWAKDDDPLEEHRKRKAKMGYSCPFFANSDPPASDSSQSVKPSSKASTSKPPSRTASKSKLSHQDMVMPTKTHDGDPDGSDYENSDSAKSSTSKTPARKPRSASGSTKKSTAKTPRGRSASRSLKNVIEVDESEAPDDEPPATVKKKKTTTRARSKSVARSVASELDEVEEEEPAVAPPTTVKKKKATTARARSKSVARSEQAEQSDVEEAPSVQATVKKPSRAKGKSKAPAPSEAEEDEDKEEEVAPRKSSRTRNKSVAPATVKKPASKSRGKAKVVEQEPEAETADEDTDAAPPVAEVAKPRTTKKPPSTATSKAKGKAKKVQEEIAASEDEFGPIIEQPPFAPAAVAKAKPLSTAKKQPLAAAASIGKGKPPSSRGKPVAPPVATPLQTDDDDELGGYVPPQPPSPPKPVSTPLVDEDVEMTPLVIPKRTVGTKLKKPQGSFRASQTPSESSEASGPTRRAPKATRPSQSKPPSSSKVRSSINKAPPKSQMKVVDVSSSEDEDLGKVEKELEEVVEVEEIVQPRVDLASKTKTKKKRATEVDKSKLLGSNTLNVDEKSSAAPAKGETKGKSPFTPTPVQAASSSSSQDVENILSKEEKDVQPAEDGFDFPESGDVSMQETDVQETQIVENDIKMQDAAPPPAADAEGLPRTPLRPPAVNLPAEPDTFGTPGSSHPPENSHPIAGRSIKESGGDASQEEQQTSSGSVPPPFFPPLSKLPFVPLQELTEAELDMTVEEWIRYQTEVEFDKFRRDGERELQRFRKRAEEARKVIEGL